MQMSVLFHLWLSYRRLLKLEYNMSKIKRSFYPGSEWVYIKIYCGINTSDNIITNILLAVSNQLIAEDVIIKWFYIRYTDPNFHLRYRCLLKRNSLFSYVLNRINKSIHSSIEEKKIYRVVIDTYNRELERYGENSIEKCESLFYLNSCITAQVLSLVRTYGENLRWLSAFVLIDSFLSKFDLTERQAIINLMDEEIKTALDLSNSQVRLNLRYRELRSSIISALEANSSFHHINLIRDIIQQIDCNQHLIDISHKAIPSLIHMMMNRLFIHKNRLNEFVVYNFLNRYYKSFIAQSKYRSSIK